MQTLIASKWEYLVEERANASTIRQLLAERGEEGWELVHVLREHDASHEMPTKTLRMRREEQFQLFFKRSK